MQGKVSRYGRLKYRNHEKGIPTIYWLIVLAKIQRRLSAAPRQTLSVKLAWNAGYSKQEQLKKYIWRKGGSVLGSTAGVT